MRHTPDFERRRTLERLRNPEHILRSRTLLPRSVEESFDFFSDASNLERITPPELRFRIVPPVPQEIREGTLIDYRLSLFGLPFGWRTEITRWAPPFEFVDTQLSGPYAQWIHRHTFTPSDGGTIMEDEVRYRLPVPLAGEVAFPVVRLQLGRIFRYRGRRIRELIGA